MRKILLTLLFIAPLSLLAQVTGTVRGIIIEDETDEALPFATIALTPEGGSAPTAGCSTDMDGSFRLDNIKAGKYTVKASFVGYLDESRTVTISAGKNNINLGTIRLKSDRKLLKEVVVTEQRSQMSFEIDKRVFTVDQSLATTGGSASDVLAEIPSVEVDNEGTVSLRGSESVTVWINGKASGMTSDNQGDILQQLPAGSIEKIEVITNPSAKHSPEGTAGIINIVLKRDRKAGYYGSVQAGMDSELGYNAGGNINYSSGKFDAYAGLNYRNMRFENEGVTDTRYTATERYQKQTNIGSHNPNNIFGRAGFTWRMTEKDELYANVMGMFGGGRHNNEILSESGFINPDGTYADPTQMRTRTTTQRGKPTMYNVELGYTHRWSDTHFIDFSVGHHQWQQSRNAEYRQSTMFFSELGDTTIIDSYQFQDGKNRNNTTEIKLDYEYKINENHRIEAGYKGDISNDNSPVITYNDEAHTLPDTMLYNKFNYKQNIQALYATYSGRIGKFGYQVGLRGEYWNVKTRSYGWHEEQSGEIPGYTNKNFFQLFPSAFVSYEISKGQEIQVNYTRRLRRPWGGQLNSFQNISDSTNISFGNPNLTPEYSNAYEINYLKNWENHTLSLSGYYRTTDDVIERISYSTGNIIYTTHENVAKTQSAGLEIVGKNRLFKRLDLTTTVNLFYYKLDAFKYTINGQEITGDADENFSWNARMTANVMLPWGITLQATGRYDAKRIVAQGYREPSYSLDLGLRKMFNQNWSVSINARDILDSRGRETVTINDQFYRYSKNSHGGRRFGITVTYSFGNMKAKKPNQKQMQEMPSGGYDDMGGMGEM
ncbi:MAG: TonB-dependent receptor [Bacteroidaceae bacterium]|nr:TonB-dependent receptor [Bacteroidaceae bacterium]